MLCKKIPGKTHTFHLVQGRIINIPIVEIFYILCIMFPTQKQASGSAFTRGK